MGQERDYDKELFDGRVERIPVEDHNPPHLGQIFAFLERAGLFGADDPSHVIAVHCKGGKGRTGVMVAAWLMYTEFRYVHYVEKVLKTGGFSTPTIILEKIVMNTSPHMDKKGGCSPFITIEENGKVVFDYREKNSVFVNMPKSQPSFEFDCGGIKLQGDIRIIVYDHVDSFESFFSVFGSLFSSTENEMCCFFSFHTGFIEASQGTVSFPKTQIEVACHDHKSKIFDNAFSIDLHVQSASEAPIPDAGDSAALTHIGKEESSLMAAGNTAGGPYRRIIKPAKALVSSSRVLRQAAEAAIESKAKSGGGGGSTCCSCICCPDTSADHAKNQGSTVASLAFESEKKKNQSGSMNPTQGDEAALTSPG